ncbi:MAG: hypothetical protein E7665_06785 [Ruminococcaceae bacterium]|nr:hypothetical protein [Oscillospiraceae bacterium]
MSITEKVSYLKGLLEGFKIDDSTSEGKVLTVMADILGDLAESVTQAKDDIEYLNEYIEEIDDDLADVEDALDEIYDEDDYDEDDDEDYDDDEYEEDDDYSDLFEVTCPSCGETVFLDDSIDPSCIICPACNAEFSDIIEK